MGPKNRLVSSRKRVSVKIQETDEACVKIKFIKEINI
jgi:hypothetical protein